MNLASYRTALPCGNTGFTVFSETASEPLVSPTVYGKYNTQHNSIGYVIISNLNMRTSPPASSVEGHFPALCTCCHSPTHLVPQKVSLQPTSIGVQGFEPWTSWSQTKRSTKLSHTPIYKDNFGASVTQMLSNPITLYGLEC